MENCPRSASRRMTTTTRATTTSAAITVPIMVRRRALGPWAS
jgi:hypothetical protein